MATTGKKDDFKSQTSSPNFDKSTSAKDSPNAGWDRSNERTEGGVGDTTFSGSSYDTKAGGASTFSGNEAQSSTGSNLSAIPGGKSRNENKEEGWGAQLQDVAGETLEKAKDMAGDFAVDAQKKLTEWGQGAMDAVKASGETVSTKVRQYPLQSLLVGFSVGCLAGLLIPRRR